MPITFIDATHEDIIPLIGLSAPSGGGKSHTAMRLALGIQQSEAFGTGPIVMIDTDNGRGRMLAPRPGQKAAPPLSFDFKYLNLTPPFAPSRFKDAIEAAKMLSPSCIIVDNISDEWNGEGGILEFVDDAQSKGGNKFGAWNKPKVAHKSFVAMLRQCYCPVVITAMAEDKLALSPSGQPVHIGWTPIVCKTPPLARDFTFHFLVGLDGKPGTLTGSREKFDHAKSGIGAEGLIKDGELGTEDVGKRLAMWAAGKEDQE